MRMKLIINKIANHCTRFISCICIVWLIFCQINAQSLLTENFNYAQSTLLRSFTWTPFAETDIRNLTVHEDNTNDAVKLSVNPSLSSEPFESDIADSSRIALIQDLEANIPILEVDDLNVGSIGESMTSAIYDFGDVPVSYENSKDGVFLPAGHIPLAGFSLGSIVPDVEEIPYSVANGEDNNDSNGDGLDEDAVEVSLHQIRKAVPYSLSLPVNNPATSTKYLYGWIDFNNDGKFQAEEFTNTAFSVVGSSTQTLNWTATQTATIASPATKLYMRLRISDRALSDFTNAAGGGAIIDERSIGNGAVSANNPADFGTAANGEVEDYQIEVLTTYDYGDLPSSFENDKDGNLIPALHAPLTGFTIGSLIDLEQAPASVNSQNENNTAGDNAVELADEDGITSWPSVSRGVAYTLTVPVNIPNSLAGTKYLYAWLDLNGDGRFQSEEVTSAATNAIAPANLTLTWTAAQTATLVRGTTKVYLRVRLSNLILTDFTTAASGGSLLDERSVGNGATTTANAANNPNIAFGEVEDYQMPVDLYHFGDVPVSYEINSTDASTPARQIVNSLYSIGNIIDEEQDAQSVAPGDDNNGTNGDGIDEDGLTEVFPVITKGAPFSFSVPVTVQTASYVIAWIDFNNNGKFEANETGYTLPTGVTNGYQNAAVGTSTKTFWFRGTQTNNIPNEINNLYVRIRLSQTTGTDNASTAVIDERSIGDGANTGIYTVPTNGEIEDYQFPVKTDMDFGDTPESYDMDKDGLINPDNFKPARNHVTDALFLGLFYTLEKEPFSVAPGADNNDPNGDGASDDGLSQDQLRIRTNAVNTYLVGVNNSTGAAATLYAWIDFNNNGRFEAGESASTTVANNSISATVSFSAAQVNNIAAATGKVYMRLRLVQSNTEVSIADLSSGTNAAVVDERAIADGLSTGSYTSASLGEVEDYQLTIIRDYGDVPSSYENGIPASQTNSPGIPELIIGSTIDYELSNNAVVSGADNNGNNGDGADEDGINTPQTITSGTPFSITIPINTTLTGTKSLYAWIDFNGDGIFNGNEAATVSANITAGTTRNLTLTWNATNVSDSLMTAGKTYVRLRLSGAAITNSNSANPALIDTRSFGQGLNAGEIEDYQFQVSNLYDYGDVPVGLYEYTRDTVPVLQAARQAPSAVLRLGAIIDTEPAPNSVSADADNNGTNGDGTDEDGISSPGDIYKGKNYYSRVSVLNNTGAAKTLYSWIDFNNNGRFESSEIATVSVPTSTVQQVVTLFWTSTNTNNIPVGTDHLYMRLRISESPSLADFTTGAPGLLLDERSIGDGLNTGMYGIAYGGEIEDYQLHVVTTYDYGDVSDTYDTSRNGIIAPARQAASHGLYLGNAFADHEAVKQIETGTALGDDNNEVDDEDGTITGAIVSGGGYSVNVTATNNTGTAKTLYGWIDFNDNGRFEASEATTVAVSSGINQGTVTLNWAPSASVITGNPGQLLMRLRLSEGALNDFTTGASGLLVDERALADGASTGEYEAIPVIHNGEIEDHTIQVTTDLDYGDVPEEYEKPSTSFIPARQMSSIALHIGGTPDIEPSVQSVASGADNNGSNGDGLDEDGIDPTATEILRGAAFSLPVKVTNTIGVAKTLYGWIDINNNGLFERKEAASVSVPANTVNGTATLNWTASNTRAISASNVYVRLRLSDGALTDNTRTATYDERAVGDGLSSGIYGANALRGEIEDYRLKVTNLLTCTGTSNIPPNGVITINGIEITTSSKGSVTTYNPAYGSCVGNRLSPGSLYVGSAGEWLVTFKLNKPVNDLVILLSGTGSGGNENFIFNSNGGTVSLYSDTNCNSVINGNVILSGAGAQSSTGGGGVFRISATNAFTTLTITGSGGHAGSLLGMCSASITVQPPIISSISPDEQTVCENVIPGTITALATGAGNLSYTWYTNTNNNNTGGTLISGAHSASYTPPASSSAGTNYYYVVVTDDNTSTTSPPVSVIINECATFCYKPGLKSGNPLESKTGITSLGRAGAADPDNWPMVRRGAWMVMESKTKGFVVNRTAFDSSGNPVGIPTVDFVEGMMVYDTTNNCLKVYTSTDNGTTFSWQCMDTQSCPD